MFRGIVQYEQIPNTGSQKPPAAEASLDLRPVRAAGPTSLLGRQEKLPPARTVFRGYVRVICTITGGSVCSSGAEKG